MANIARKKKKLQPSLANGEPMSPCDEGDGDLGISPQTFLDTIFVDADPDTETVCVSKGFATDDGVGFWNVGDDEKPWLNWKPQKQKQAWYFCVSTVDGERNEKNTAVKRKTSNVVRYHVLVLDDIGTKATPPPVDPTYRLTSSMTDDGTPNEQWGYALHPGEDFKRYEALVEYCHEKNWGDAGAGGCYRIMRVVNSTNIKPGRNNFMSIVTHWNPNRIWTLDELATALGCTNLDERATKAKGNKRTLHGTVTGTSDGSIDLLYDWLDQNGHVVSDNGGDFIDVTCPWAVEHTSGGDIAGYSPLGRGEGDWVQARGFRCLHEHCKGRGFRDFMKEMGDLGAPRCSGVDVLPWLQDRYVYVAVGKRVADLHQRPKGGTWLYELEDWSNLHRGRVMVPGRDQPVEMKTAFLESKNTRKTTDTQYWPVRRDEDTAIVVRNEQELINTYVPPSWEPTKEDPEVFLDHTEFLIPDEHECDVFLDWLAYKIQNPDKRSYAMVMIAEDGFGVGRSWLKSMLELVLGPKSVNTATLPQLVGTGTSSENNYNDWAANCQFIIVEEAKDSVSKDDFYKGYETFKSRIDNRVSSVRVNPKYGRTRDEYMFFNALIFSNHSDALVLPEKDRRVCVVMNPSVMGSHKYYDRLEASLTDAEARKIYWYLMERDISAYAPVYPPMTPGKQRMIEQNTLPSDAIRDHILDVCDGDLFTKKMLKSRIISAASAFDYDNIIREPGTVIRALWGKLENLRPSEKNGARYTISDSEISAEVRAIRNVEKWKELDAKRDSDAFVAELSKNGKPGVVCSIKNPK
jgi:hypothetical protein